MKRAQKREYLIDTATRLFNQRGFHATGIDQVIAESGIAKTTLYRHFNSKDELVVEVLKRVDEKFRNDMREYVDKKSQMPKKKLLATFDFLEKWFKDKSFYGCPFMSAAGEYGERLSPVFQTSSMHKRLMIAYLEELSRAANLKHPKRIAEELNLLHEGATAVAHITGEYNVALKAKAMAERIIEDADDNDVDK